MDIKKAFGKRVEILKNEKRLSWEKLAYSAGLSKGAMTDIKHGKTDVKFSTICKVAIALDMTVSKLLDFEFDINEID